LRTKAAQVLNSDGVGVQEVLPQQGNLEQALEIPSTAAQQRQPVYPVGSFDTVGFASDTGTQQPVGEGETSSTTATGTEEEPQEAPAAVERLGEVAYKCRHCGARECRCRTLHQRRVSQP